MALYFLDYDLRKSRSYQSLYNELARLGAVRMLESSWCLTNTATAVDIRDHFKQFIDGDDGLWVAQVTSWASVGVTNTPQSLTSA